VLQQFRTTIPCFSLVTSCISVSSPAAKLYTPLHVVKLRRCTYHHHSCPSAMRVLHCCTCTASVYSQSISFMKSSSQGSQKKPFATRCHSTCNQCGPMLKTTWRYFCHHRYFTPLHQKVPLYCHTSLRLHLWQTRGVGKSWTDLVITPAGPAD
jgi:hypothetical protein